MRSTGIWNLNASNSLPGSSVTNAGTLNINTSGGTGTIAFGIGVNNTGTSGDLAVVDVIGGGLNLGGGGTDSFASYIGAGTLGFTGGTRTLDANSNIATTSDHRQRRHDNG